MQYKDFLRASEDLKQFIRDQDRLSDLAKVITGTAFCDFGNRFVDDYIRVVEIALGDETNAFSWFALENDFGKKKLKVKIEGKEYKICNEKQFYDVCIEKYNKETTKK
jgi:hypothetical protein